MRKTKSFSHTQKRLSRIKRSTINANENMVAAYHEILPEYENISRQYIDSLLDIYSQDLELFGYGYDIEHNMAYCGIETQRGICC